MLNIDLAHHLESQQRAVALRQQIRHAVADEVARGLKNVFFASAGGVALLTLPAARLLQQRSTLPVFADWAAELVEWDSARLGPGSLVIFCSVSGTTKEALAALEFARAKGARVLSFVGTEGSAMHQLSDICFTCPSDDDTCSEIYLTQTLILALALLEARDELDSVELILQELQHLPEALIAAKEAFEPDAPALARALAARKQPVMVTGAGGAWYEASYFAADVFEERQWIWARPIHASDFFHGTLELVDEGVAVLVLQGEDPGRGMAERVAAFVPRVGGEVFVIDSRQFALDGISEATRSLVSTIVLATVLERLAVHIEAITGHPLDTRRYFKKMDY